MVVSHLPRAARFRGARRRWGAGRSAVIDDELRELRWRLDAAMRERWQRSLPLQELLSDRWERAKELGFGEGSSIYASSYVYGTVHVGAGTWIGPFTLLDGTGGLT